MRDGDPTADFLQFRASGDPAALARVFDALAPRLLLLALHLTRNRADAEDVLQDTFVAAIAAASNFEVDRDVRSWLSGILANQSAMLRRRRARQIDPGRVREAPQSTPLDAVGEAEGLARIDRAIDALPDAQREVLVLRLHHGLTGREIARALGRSVDTVHTQLRRGLGALRQRLPAALGAVLAAVEEPGRGLAAVRAVVLDRVTMRAAASVGAGAGTALGVLVMKKLLVVFALVLLIGGAMLQPWRGGAPPVVERVASEWAVGDRGVRRTTSDAAVPSAARTSVIAAGSASRARHADFVVEGRCVDAATGDGILGCTIGLRVTRDGVVREVLPASGPQSSGATGHFRLELSEPPIGSLALTAQSPDHVPNTRRLTPARTDGVDFGTIELRRGWKPSGRVVLRDGTPAPAGLPVKLSCDECYSHATTGVGGTFDGEGLLPAGALRAGVGDGWHVASVEPPHHRRGEPPPVVQIVVERIEGSLTGIVVDPRGVPIADAIVSVHAVTERRFHDGVISGTETDAAGRFEAQGRRPYTGLVAIRVRKSLVEWIVEPQTLQWGDQDVRVVATAPAAAVLEIVDALDGTPVPRVSCRRLPVGSRHGATVAGRVTVDGRVAVPLEAEVVDVVVSAVSPGGPYAWVRLSSVSDDGRLVRVELPRAERRVVRVRSADGRPIARSRVRSATAHGVEPHADSPLWMPHSRDPRPGDADGIVQDEGWTDERGEVELVLPLPAENVWLLLDGPHLAKVLPLPSSDLGAPIEVVVDRGRVLDGFVDPRDAAARLGGSVHVFLLRIDDRRVRRDAPLGADGRFEIGGLVDGSWQLAVSCAPAGGMTGGASWTHVVPGSVEIGADEGPVTIDLDAIVAARAAGSLEVRVLRDGRPLAASRLALVLLERRSDGTLRQRDQFEPRISDLDGQVRFERLPPGAYRLIDLDSAGAPASDELIEIRPGERTTTAATFRSRSLRIRLVDRDGAPLAPTQRVRLSSGTALREPSGLLDGSGEITFHGLGAGPWRVMLVSPEGDRELGTVMFDDGDLEPERQYTVR